MGTVTLANGNKAKLMDMEYTLGKMVISMKENGVLAWDMEMALISFAMGICILANISMENLKVMVSINGKMETNIQECFRMGLSMEKESGEKSLL